MTTMLSRVAKPKAMPPRIVLYGGAGVGKTTLACNTKNPVVLPLEDGAGKLDTPAFPQPQDFSDVLACLKDLLDGEHDYKSLVIDSADRLEPLIWDATCREHSDAKKTYKSIEDFGYGKGYIAADPYWTLFFQALDGLRRARGMTVCVIAHSAVVTVQDPALGVYNRHEPKLHKRANAMMKEWCDLLLFMQIRRYSVVHEDAKGRQLNAATATGERVLYTEERTGYEAKNRFGLVPEIIIPEKEPFGALRTELVRAMGGK